MLLLSQGSRWLHSQAGYARGPDRAPEIGIDGMGVPIIYNGRAGTGACPYAMVTPEEAPGS